MPTLKIAKDLFDLLYPVGTYYETSNASWTPSNAGWYGTWVEDTAGKTTVAKDSGTFKTLGGNVGSESNSHYHDYKIALPFDYGDVIADNLNSDYYGAYSYQNNKYGKARNNSEIANLSVFVNGGHTQSGSSKTWGRVASSTGDTNSKNVSTIQPSIVVRRWHRTA